MINSIGLRFHHFGLAARDPAQALGFLGAAGYRCGERVWDPLQGVDLHWCEKDASPAVEVVSPPVGGDGPLAAILSDQGASFYHLCYAIDQPLQVVTARLLEEGVRLAMVRPPLPAVLFGGRKVSFHVVRGFGLVEILEDTPVAAERARGG